MATHHARSQSRTPSHVPLASRSRSPSVNSERVPQISRTPSPNFRQSADKSLPPNPPAPVPTPPPTARRNPEIHVHKTMELHERLPRAPLGSVPETQHEGRQQPNQTLRYQDSSPALGAVSQRKVPNAYYLQRKMSEPEIPQPAHLAGSKHKPAALNLPPIIQNDHGFPEDPNRPISQRPFSQNYPWPYDPSSYYNMARSPTIVTHPKPKAYPVGWEENGGLSRPVSMGGIDLPIPLSPMPPVPGIPEQYRKENAGEEDNGPNIPEPKVLYDHERDGLEGQVADKKLLKQQKRAQQKHSESNSASTQTTHEYIPQASPLESLTELWEFAAHGKLLSKRQQSKVGKSAPYSHHNIPEGVYVLNMYRGAPLNAQQPVMPGGFVPEHFAFGPDPTHPFYTIQALPDALHPDNSTVYNPNDPATFFNDLLILRRNPVTHKDTSVLTMGLNPHSATAHRQRLILAANGQSQTPSTPQGDELITLIYPKQAAMMAIDSSAIHVDDKTGRIVGGDAQTMAREAVERAAETECCRLSWDAVRDRYYLYHPGIGLGGEVYLVIIDDGNYSQSKKVTEPSPGVGFDVYGTKGSIKLINVDTSEAIVVLDFKSGLLFINTMATRKIPSLYIVDVAVSTVLAVAVVEGRRIRDQQLFKASLHNGDLQNGYPGSIALRDPKRPGMVAGGGWSDSTLGRSYADGTQVAEKRGGGYGGAGGASGGAGVTEGRDNTAVIDIAGIIINIMITIVAFIVGLFWAIGSAIGKIFSGKKRQGGDLEYGHKGHGNVHNGRHGHR
ncbi:hypothetical protein BDZ91DRAFT_798799 [Kalaharituber pfeilii]|nr:hypothetical protein BDZ91DRAFT_798799 [Kalaharituber pfeilii]